jgi:hypothetical protein
MRTFLAAFVAVLALAAAVAGAALAADPGTRGQPNKNCQSLNATTPPGIVSTTNGFATMAVNVYAGTQPQNSTNPMAVSQYDVACFQTSP